MRLVAQLGVEIEEHQERLKILAEHLKSVQMELVHTQSLVSKIDELTQLMIGGREK